MQEYEELQNEAKELKGGLSMQMNDKSIEIQNKIEWKAIFETVSAAFT